MIQGRRTGNWVVTISRRLENPDGTPRGVIGASVHASRFHQYYETAMLNGPRGTHNVMHADGSLIFRSPMPAAEMKAGSLRELVARLMAPFGTGMTVSTIDGVERLIAWRHFDDFPLVTVAGVPLEEVYAEWWQRSRIIIGVAFFWALALALLGAFAWRAIRREEEVRALATAGEARYTEALEQERDRAVQAKQDKAVLLNELHHRVKNNLQILSSLAMMQKLRAGALAPQLDSFTARIEAIAKVHEVLSHADEVEQIDFRAYAESLVRDLVRANGRDAIEVAVDGSGHLSLERATPLGIVLNELVTNILKYGFEGRDRGRISLTVRQTDSAFTLRLADDGIGAPIPTASPRKSLGLSLINNLLRQIDAEMEVETVPGRGASWTITCPLAGPVPYMAGASPAAVD
jgi:two-component sensor histidine kinase